ATGAASSSVQGTATPPEQPDQPDRFIRRPEVCHITSVPPSSITDLIRKGDFPAAYKLSERMAAWKLSEVTAWMNSRQRAV
ncbi:unnamed protein product, partial [Cyprideis torosa]